MKRQAIRGIFKTAFRVVVFPEDFWRANRDVPQTQSQLLGGYLLPLLLVESVAHFTGELLKGQQFYLPFALTKSLREIVLFVLVYFLSVMLVNRLFSFFGAAGSLQDARRLVAYSLTPMVLVSVVTGLVPFLYPLEVLGLFGYYIFWLGARELLVFNSGKLVNFCLTAILLNLFIFGILTVLLWNFSIIFY